MNTDSDDTILNSLVTNGDDIGRLDTKLIAKCITLIQIQIKAFEIMFEADKDSELELTALFEYVDGGEFKNNENDLLIVGRTVQVLHPIYLKLIAEMKKRKLGKDESIALWKECVNECILR